MLLVFSRNISQRMAYEMSNDGDGNRVSENRRRDDNQVPSG